MSRDRNSEAGAVTELARVTTLEQLVEACRDRRKQLGLPQLLVDELSGMQNGYTGKLEAGIKGLGKLTLPLLLGALKLELVVQPERRTAGTSRAENARSEDFFTRRARKAAKSRWDALTPKQRSKAMRAVRKAGLRKVKA